MGRAADWHSGGRPAGEQIFFRNSICMHVFFLKFSFDGTVTYLSLDLSMPVNTD